jgi:predicted RNA binding protein YcfA (HicA-like mRNA interferase family)
MTDWPSMRPHKLVAILKKHGWNLARQKGSHRFFRKAGWASISVAYHDGEDIPPLKVRAIAKDAGLTLNDFMQK